VGEGRNGTCPAFSSFEVLCGLWSAAEVKKWIKASSKGAAGEAEEGAVQRSETAVMAPSKLKVEELRRELKQRGLETSGLKASARQAARGEPNKEEAGPRWSRAASISVPYN
jgi:hypothetical protein